MRGRGGEKVEGGMDTSPELLRGGSGTALAPAAANGNGFILVRGTKAGGAGSHHSGSWL